MRRIGIFVAIAVVAVLLIPATAGAVIETYSGNKMTGPFPPNGSSFATDSVPSGLARASTTVDRTLAFSCPLSQKTVIKIRDDFASDFVPFPFPHWDNTVMNFHSMEIRLRFTNTNGKEKTRSKVWFQGDPNHDADDLRFTAAGTGNLMTLGSYTLPAGNVLHQARAHYYLDSDEFASHELATNFPRLVVRCKT